MRHIFFSAAVFAISLSSGSAEAAFESAADTFQNQDGTSRSRTSRPLAAKLTPRASTNSSSIQISGTAQTIHGGVVIPTFIVVFEDRQFSFVPPQGWRVQSATESKTVRLVNPGTGEIIEIAIVLGDSASRLLLSNDQLRDAVLQRFANPKIVEEFSISALGVTGLAFDIESRTTNNLLERTRCAFIAFPHGYLQFTVSLPPGKESQTHHDFNRLLLSLRSAAVGEKLPLQPVQPE